MCIRDRCMCDSSRIISWLEPQHREESARNQKSWSISITFFSLPKQNIQFRVLFVPLDRFFCHFELMFLSFHIGCFFYLRHSVVTRFLIIFKPKSMSKTMFFFLLKLWDSKRLRESVKVDLAIKKKKRKKNTPRETVEEAKRRIKWIHDKNCMKIIN